MYPLFYFFFYLFSDIFFFNSLVQVLFFIFLFVCWYITALHMTQMSSDNNGTKYVKKRQKKNEIKWRWQKRHTEFLCWNRPKIVYCGADTHAQHVCCMYDSYIKQMQQFKLTLFVHEACFAYYWWMVTFPLTPFGATEYCD